jgi:hypothetical protein
MNSSMVSTGFSFTIQVENKVFLFSSHYFFHQTLAERVTVENQPYYLLYNKNGKRQRRDNICRKMLLAFSKVQRTVTYLFQDFKRRLLF